MYPNYRFRPVHNKNKEKKPKTDIPAEDEKRCEDVAQLLLEGMKGEELAAAVERLDRMRSSTPLSLPRRPSSVPLSNSFPIAIPALPFVEPSRPHSPQQMNPPRYTLPRRPSSAGPSLFRSWTEPFNIPREPSPMPEINASLFNGDYLDNAFPGTSSQSDASFVSFISFCLAFTMTTKDKIIVLWFDVWLPSWRGTTGNVHFTPGECHVYGPAERICVVGTREHFCANFSCKLPRSRVDLLGFTRAFGLFPALACITSPCSVTISTRIRDSRSAGTD